MDVSIIIPVYNSSETVIESIDSVVRECLNNSYMWELIVIDDGSRDSSVRVIEQYIESSSFKQNIIFICQENGGAAAARNTGIRVAKGKFIAFNDADDRWLLGKLKLQMEYMKNNPDVVMLAGTYGEDRVSKIKRMKFENIITIKDQVFKFYFSPQCVLLRTSILGTTGLFDETMRHAEEGSLFNKIVYNGKSILLLRKVSEPITSKERWGDSGLSGNIVGMQKGSMRNIMNAHKLGYISFPIYLMAMGFSAVKFIRRMIISKIRKIKRIIV